MIQFVRLRGINMLVMTGASASGKTEIAKIIIKKYGFMKMVTYTTRPMRDGEMNGVDYHFISQLDFLDKLKNNEFLETTFYNHNYYGTAFKDADYDKVLIVDTNGANLLFKKMPQAVTIFFLKAPKEVRTKRMVSRGDKQIDIDKRLSGDDIYFDELNMKHIDFIINTHDCGLEELADKIYQLYCNKQIDIK